MSDGKSIKILIVDDDEITREIYTEVFKKSNFEVLEAEDGVEGLDIATKQQPDVVFTGIIMPRMDGFTLMDSLKKNVTTSNIPVVISSHLGRAEDQQKANEMGAKDFIVRDMTTPNEVVTRISALLLGGSYNLQFDPYAADAARLAHDLNLNDNYQCVSCNQRMHLQLEPQDSKNAIFKAKFICPNCGNNKVARA